MNSWSLAIDIGTASVIAAVSDQDGIEILEFADRARLAPTAVTAPEAMILKAVAQRAAQGRAPAVPGRLLLTHPAHAAKQELSLLRAAAAAADLPDPVLTAKPVAIASHLAPAAIPGQVVAVVDLGDDGTDTAVLRRTRRGFTLIGSPGRASRLADDDAAASLRRGIYEMAATIAIAGLTPDQLTAIHVVGEASDAPETADLITQILGPAPRVHASPQAAAALGLLDIACLSRPKPGQSTFPYRMRRRLPRFRTVGVITGIAITAAVAAVMGLLISRPGSVPESPGFPTGSLWSGKVVVAYVLTSGVATATPTVMPIDTATNTTGQPIPVGLNGQSTSSIAVTPDGKTVIVATWGPISQASATVTLIHATDDIASKPIPVGAGTDFIAVTPDSKTAYIASYDSSTVIPLTIATGKTGPPIPLGTGPRADAIAVTPDGKTVYVASQTRDGTVTPIATETNTAGPPIRVGMYPSAIAIAPDGNTAYVVNSGNGIVPGTITPINTQTNTAGQAIAVGYLPQDLTITPDGKTAYVVNTLPVSITAIDTASDKAAPPIRLASNSRPVVASNGQDFYFIQQAASTSSGTDTVSRINMDSHTISPLTSAGISANSYILTITPDGKTIYIAEDDPGSGTATVMPVNTVTGSPGAPITLNGLPEAIALGPLVGSLPRTAVEPSPSSSNASRATPVLGTGGPGTKGCGTKRPGLIYGGGDASDQVTDIRWQSWGRATATGMGEMLWVTTTVSAATLEPVRLVAYDLGLLHGQYAYRSLDIYFPLKQPTNGKKISNYMCQ